MREKEIDYLQAKESSAELAKSEKCKPMFKQWLHKIVKEHRSLTVSEVVNAGAERTNLSQQTIMRYLQSACSFEGNYELFDCDGKKFVRFKPEYVAKIKAKEKQHTSDNVIPIQHSDTG